MLAPHSRRFSGYPQTAPLPAHVDVSRTTNEYLHSRNRYL
jgi:hypothetical protein